MSGFTRARILSSSKQPFDVMKAFSQLDSVRKMALFDRLSDSRKTFHNTVTLFWPNAGTEDCKTLEKFLTQRIVAND